MTPTELSGHLGRLINSWENEVVEFKTASSQYSADKTGEYVLAIANEANLRGLAAGWMVFGIDDEYYAKLVVEYLERFGQGTRKEIDAFLWNKLPDVLTADQKQSKVHNLLTRLRKQGAIESVGATRSARWQLSSTERTVE